MSDTATDVHDQWLSDVLGLDPKTYPTVASQDGESGPARSVDPAASAPDQSLAANAEASGGSDAAQSDTISGRMIIPAEKTFEAPPAPFNFQYVSGSVGFTIKLKGAIEVTKGAKGSSSMDVTPQGYSDGYVERLGRTWYSTDGVKICGVNTGASESKIEGQAKIKGGLEVSVAVSLKWANGEELKLKFTVVKLDNEWKVSAGALQGDYVFKSIELSGYPFEDVKFKGSIQVAAVVKLQPNYVAIGAQLGEVGSTVAAAGRAIAAFITFDGLIAAGFVAGGVLTVVAAVKGLADAAEIRALSGVVDQTTNALTAGFVAGVQGLPNSAGSIGQPGYDMGVQAFAEARANVLKKVPDATDQEIHDVVNEFIKGKEARIYALVKPTAQQAVWEAWASSKTGWLDSSKDLKWGWVNIYGRLPAENDPEYRKYYKD